MQVSIGVGLPVSVDIGLQMGVYGDYFSMGSTGVPGQVCSRACVCVLSCVLGRRLFAVHLMKHVFLDGADGFRETHTDAKISSAARVLLTEQNRTFALDAIHHCIFFFLSASVRLWPRRVSFTEGHKLLTP